MPETCGKTQCVRAVWKKWQQYYGTQKAPGLGDGPQKEAIWSEPVGVSERVEIRDAMVKVLLQRIECAWYEAHGMTSDIRMSG